MKTLPLLVLSVGLALVLAVRADNLFPAAGNVVLKQAAPANEVAGPIRLDLHVIDGSALSLSYDAQRALPRIGTFSITSSAGEWHWRIAAGDKTDRLQMKLDHQNVITLYTAPARGEAPATGIVLDPNAATISLNGANVLTQASLNGLTISNGNLGIGSTVPTATLEVIPGIIGAANTVTFHSARVSKDLSVNQAIVEYRSHDGVKVGLVDYLGRLGVNPGGIDGFDTFTIDASMLISTRVASANGLIIRSVPEQSNDLLSLQDSVGTDLAVIRATGGAYFGGNVGIGTANPQAKLDVAGVVRVQPGGDIPMFQAEN